ncbi:MAG: hypothetical protein M0014_12135 [Actinomycetota bacterium]|nr:hypothetical protein [Actinomycetota bacterium]
MAARPLPPGVVRAGDFYEIAGSRYLDVAAIAAAYPNARLAAWSATQVARLATDDPSWNDLPADQARSYLGAEPERRRSEASERGRRVRAWIRDALDGLEAPPMPELVGYTHSAISAITALRPRLLARDVVVGADEGKYAGQVDLFVSFGADGHETSWVIEWNTSPAIAPVHRYKCVGLLATSWLVTIDGQHARIADALPPVAGAIIVNLRPDGSPFLAKVVLDAAANAELTSLLVIARAAARHDSDPGFSEVTSPSDLFPHLTTTPLVGAA